MAVCQSKRHVSIKVLELELSWVTRYVEGIEHGSSAVQLWDLGTLGLFRWITGHEYKISRKYCRLIDEFIPFGVKLSYCGN
jgi:hypothetical protein